MRWQRHGRDVFAGDIELDDLGWDHHDSHGDVVLNVQLQRLELAAVGVRIHRLGQQWAEEEPGYFTDELMRDVPVPTHPDVFADHPMDLLHYLRDPFWSRETAVALMRQSDPHRDARRPPRYLLQECRSAAQHGPGLTVSFAAVAASASQRSR